MTVLRQQRMTEDMQVRNLSPNTQASYLQQVSLLTRYFRTSRDALTPEHIRTYQIYLTHRRDCQGRTRPARPRAQYRKWFRQIARAAGIPDEVWSMDSRAGGATEADEAGADLKAISDHLTHSETRTTVRYIRRVACLCDCRGALLYPQAGG